jgi:hypothetical protein
MIAITAMPHIRTITKVSGGFFRIKKYTKLRLYRSRYSHGSPVWEVIATILKPQL